MNKLFLIILLCTWTAGSDAHKMGQHPDASWQIKKQRPEPMELFNPFVAFRN